MYLNKIRLPQGGTKILSEANGSVFLKDKKLLTKFDDDGENFRIQNDLVFLHKSNVSSTQIRKEQSKI